MIGGAMPGHESFFCQIEAQAGEASNVRFHGHVPFQNVHGAFREARVFVNTSEIEGFPNTYLQAWAHGVPVIAFFDPDGVIAREGLGMAVNSPDEMVAAIRKLVSDPDYWSRMSDRCIKYIEHRFGEDQVLKPYTESIERLCMTRPD
jgi:glycosyltransferase involved in cell wall biosynthesis